jgi:hypothetical protein
MDLAQFKATLDEGVPPDGAGKALAALWHAARGDWEAAHRMAQAEKNQAGWWVHAYLHRVEGDLSNADHWYRRAGAKRPDAALQEEWNAIVEALLGR